MTLHDLYRIALHLPIGLLVAFSAETYPVLSAILFLCLVVYELNEDWHLRNSAYKDILGALVGIFIGDIAILILDAL
jgi:hypothetical protein